MIISLLRLVIATLHRGMTMETMEAFPDKVFDEIIVNKWDCDGDGKLTIDEFFPLE